MKKYIITTDSSSDLELEFVKKHNIVVFNLGIVKDGVARDIELKEHYKLVYDDIRKGVLMTTTAVSPFVVTQKFNKLLDDGYDILHLGFSSALSSSHANISIAANSLLSERPEGRIEVIDTVSTTIGLRSIIEKVVKLQEEKSLDEVIEWVETYKNQVIHQFVVDDLDHLFRGGRITRTSAIIGSSLKIKPILSLNQQGAIVLLKNERGVKKAKKALINHLGNQKNLTCFDKVYIGHTDALDQAHQMEDLLREKYDIKEVVIREINPVIGVHIGADALVLSYMGDSRVTSLSKTKCS